MPVNALNAALIGAVLENTPKNSNPAATVAEILNIGREAAYRRMRGEVPFTFGEAALVAARLSFSLDRIMGTDDPDCVLFRLDFSDGQTLLEDYPGKVESWIGKMEEIASDEQSEFSLAGSSLPAALYLGYERLVRFRFFKCFSSTGCSTERTTVSMICSCLRTCSISAGGSGRRCGRSTRPTMSWTTVVSNIGSMRSGRSAPCV